MGFVKEFKDFAVKGNVIDLAVGVIIGSAFGKIVSSLVNDLIMPLVGLITGGVDVSSLFVSLNGTAYASLAAAQEAGAPVLMYGQFLQNIFDFLVIAFCVFLFVKGINKMKKPAPAAAPARTCPYCLSTVAEKATRCPHCTSELELKA